MEKNNSEQQYDKMSFFYNVLYAGRDSEFWENEFLNEHHDVLNTLPKNSKIIDVSCGNGLQAASLCRHGYNVFASDISQEMVNLACQYSKQHGLNFPIAKLAWKELTQKYFDEFELLFCWGNSISHSLDKNEMLENLKSFIKVIKVGGKVILDTRNWDKILTRNARFSSYEVKRYDGRNFIPLYIWNLNGFNQRAFVDIIFVEIMDGVKTQCFDYRLDFTPFTHDEFVETTKAAGFKLLRDTFSEHSDNYYVVLEK